MTKLKQFFIDLWNNFDKKAFWEAIKLPLRLFVFAAVGFIVDYLLTVFAADGSEVGKIVFIGLTFLDKYLHEARAARSDKPLEGFSRGLLPF